MTRYVAPRRLTPEQETIVIQRRKLWRICTLEHLAAELNVSISTIRRTVRNHLKREHESSTCFQKREP